MSSIVTYLISMNIVVGSTVSVSKVKVSYIANSGD
jgi:hypothetical protein